MDAHACQPVVIAAPPMSMRSRTSCAARGAVEPEDREVLYALLVPCLGCIEAAEAMEALIARYGSFAEAVAASLRDLAIMPEVGEAGAAVLHAVQMAARRLERQRRGRMVVLAQPADWVAHLRRGATRLLPGEIHALFLNRRGRLLAEETLGAIASSAAPGLAIRRALALEAEGIVLARRCGEREPVASESDLAMMHSLDQAAMVMGLRLRDVLLLGRAGHASLMAPSRPG
ncbi:hypothetical protein KPL78_02475 [Roseomonas sp. HJA6]|uniref:RadC-like JAB domain-containing protein n=1 Tax=Roseomonas alba TaxID=2846776 RepID=A0ABS7A3M0_9PROT|nr:JAB domain-containing protein [Neoroseomonas alba]MBW6396690.1 hypothetical protein [Neoroseomonas alba]